MLCTLAWILLAIQTASRESAYDSYVDYNPVTWCRLTCANAVTVSAMVVWTLLCVSTYGSQQRKTWATNQGCSQERRAGHWARPLSGTVFLWPNYEKLCLHSRTKTVMQDDEQFFSCVSCEWFSWLHAPNLTSTDTTYQEHQHEFVGCCVCRKALQAGRTPPAHCRRRKQIRIWSRFAVQEEKENVCALSLHRTRFTTSGDRGP